MVQPLPAMTIVSEWNRLYGNSYLTHFPDIAETAKHHTQFGDVIHWQKSCNSKSDPFGEKMSNKFLPFIVEKSRPLHIYHTLLSRSKGMKFQTIASVLYIVLSRGITDVRAYVKTLPELQLEKLYEEIINHYAEKRIPTAIMTRYLNLEKYFKVPEDFRWPEKLNEYELRDILLFMVVLSHLGVKAVNEYTDLDFTLILLQYDTIMGDITKYVKFSDKGKYMEFEGEQDLEAFILYTALLNTGEDIEIRAVFKKKQEG